MNFMEQARVRAREKDRADSLAPFRGRFYSVPGKIYMDGNSLGLAGKDAEKALLETLEEWKRLGIDGWLEANPPWFYMGEKVGALMAPLVGAEPEEVVMTGGTTINLHALTSTFYNPREGRSKIVADELNFPSDIYALSSLLRLHGLDPHKELNLVKSRDGRTLDEDDIIASFGEDVGFALFPSVLYRSGQLLNIPRLVQEAHRRNIIIGFDCAHSAGSVPHRLSEDGVDFAFWCSYKHLNGGPGSPGFLYLNKKHFSRSPGMAGWFGYVKEKQFQMNLEFQHSPSAGGWQIGTPSVFSGAALKGALKVFAEAGIEEVRKKSLDLTDYLMELVDTELAPLGYSVGTPREHSRRGGHVAVEHSEAWRICCALKKRGIVPDFRPPRVIRIAPVALYNSYEEVWAVAQALKEIVTSREYENFSKIPAAVS